MLINGTEYFTSSEVAGLLGTTRQTLWRWRTEGLIPAGQKCRGRLVVYTREEVEQVRLYANRLETNRVAVRARAAVR